MKHAYILLFIFLICLLSSCKKDPAPTVLKGIIIDSQTSMPIGQSVVAITNHIPDEIGLYENLTEYTTTNDEGFFSYTVRSDAKTASLYSVSAENYATKSIDYRQFETKMETTNEYTIPLVRLDAVLQIHVKNQHDQDNNVYIVVSNPTRLKEARYVWGEQAFWPFIQIGTEDTLTIPVRSEEFTTIFWGNDNFFPSATAPFRDSLFFNEGDTLNYFIEF